MTMIDPRPLDRLLAIPDVLPEEFPREAAEELALMLDAEGVLEGLTDDDAIRVITGIVVNILSGNGPLGLARQCASVSDAAARAMTRASVLLYTETPTPHG